MGWGKVEREGAQTRHRLPQSGIVVGRKSIRPEASYLKVCIGQKRRGESEREDMLLRARSGRCRAAKLSVKSLRARKKCQRFSNLSVTI